MKERMSVFVVTLPLTSCSCTARAVNVYMRKNDTERELIKHFHYLLHDLLISQLKRTYIYGSTEKIGSKHYCFAFFGYIERFEINSL